MKDLNFKKSEDIIEFGHAVQLDLKKHRDQIKPLNIRITILAYCTLAIAIILFVRSL